MTPHKSGKQTPLLVLINCESFQQKMKKKSFIMLSQEFEQLVARESHLHQEVEVAGENAN